MPQRIDSAGMQRPRNVRESARPARRRRGAPWRAAWLLALCLPAGAGARAEEAEGPAWRWIDAVEPGQVLAGRCRLRPGTYALVDPDGAGALRIEAEGTELDLTGATLLGAPAGTSPDGYRGVGIAVRGARGVRIRGGRVRGFKVGLQAVGAPDLTVEGLDASGNFRQRLASTPEREDPADWLWPHHNDAGEWEARYGAGLSLTECDGATLRGCRVRDGQNGVLLTRCRRVRVVDGDYSFNSGWGVALYRSSDNEVSHNRCDWCVRGYSHGVYVRGQDSAGILLFEQCARNLIARNSATHGGDGLFLYAGHETTQRTGTGGSNDNLVYGNDFSHAVANAIEATFSTGNAFVANRCDDSDHGVWAGYSSDTLLADNQIEGNTSAGISIEHGQDNRLVGNRIRGGRVGVHLWWDDDREFREGAFGQRRETDSARNHLLGNEVLGAEVGVKLLDDRDAELRFNRVGGRRACVELTGTTRVAAIEHNLFEGARGAGPAPVLLRAGPGAAPDTVAQNEARGRFAAEGSAWDAAAAGPAVGHVRPAPRLPPAPVTHGTLRLEWPAGLPRGRAVIRIDEWGPVHPLATRLFPARVAARAPEARLHLLGAGPFEAGVEGPGVALEPARGVAPATLALAARGPGPALRPFVAWARTPAGRLEARGHLLALLWEVEWREWDTDPRADPAGAFAGPVVARARCDRLDFPWRTEGPAGVRPDRFATRARATLDLPAGRYRLRVVSDDGVRVRIGGEVVLENWTHHAPTEDQAEFEWPGGAQPIEVEHFELDGWAVLTLGLEPLEP